MKRRLINYDVFEKMKSNSLTSSERELVEAAPIVASSLNLSNVTLHAFDTQNALYETVDGHFIRANYHIDKNKVVFENIEELVLDEETEKTESKKRISEMLDALMENKDQKANQLLEDYLSLPSTRRTFMETKCPKGCECPTKKKKKKMAEWHDVKGKINKNISPFANVEKRDVQEWANLYANVKNYLTYVEHGPTLKESSAKYDERGNIVALSLPTAHARNESKLASFDWDVPKTQVKLLRMKGEKLCENMAFCKAVAELKRHNAVSNSQALEEALENIVSKWPEVLYLTQEELSQTVKNALDVVNATNFDDQTCDFMSEGILRTAHDAYVDRTNKILKLAGVNECDCKDKYAYFQEVVKQFYPTLDESNRLEMQMFVDLYESLRKVHSVAQRNSNAAIVTETSRHLNELSAVIREEIKPSIQIAQEAATWLATIVETNLSGSDWEVSNSVHTTLSGDNPQMAKNARHPYAPASDFSGDWGDEAPVSDGKNYRGGLAQNMRSGAWGNIGGGDTFPVLQNPYVPKPFGDYTIKGEKTVEKDDATGQWSSGDTWPNLQNPYVPKAETPKTYKMNQGKEVDLVVDQ